MPGLRAGYYLCFFGMHVLTPAVMEILLDDGTVGRTPARTGRVRAARRRWPRLARRERYLALEDRSARATTSASSYGLLTAQLALALDGDDREEMLAQLVELLASTREPTSSRRPAGRAVSRPDARVDHHRRRPGRPRPVARRAAAAGPRCGHSLAECDDAGALPPRERQPVRARAGAASSSTRSTASTCRRARRLRRPRRAIPFAGYEHLLDRRFEEAIDASSSTRRRARARATRSPARSPPPTTASLSRRSPTRSGAACARSAATSGCSASATPPTSRCASARSCCRRATGRPVSRSCAKRTPVRMDLTHSGWSDIFFLGMDYPEGARVAERLGRPRRARPRRRARGRRSRRTCA